jgi:hypothetical protein
LTSSTFVFTIKVTFFTSPIAETPLKNHLEGKLLVPQTQKNLKWVCVRIKELITAVVTKTFTADLNLLVFFFNAFYIYTIILILWDKKKNLKNKLKLGFQFESSPSVTGI